jgi:hypothetical protein
VRVSNASAFAQRLSLSSLSFGPSSQFKRIDPGAFQSCGLWSTEIPGQVQAIGCSEFDPCAQLMLMTFRGHHYRENSAIPFSPMPVLHL